MSDGADRLKPLETILGHRFDDRDFLIRALSHASAVARPQKVVDSYQRLEFLGDRVLALVISEMLYVRYVTADEGELARRLNQLVMRETCAAVAAEAGIAPFMILGDSEVKTGGREKSAILADVCEALIAALYLDGGLPAATQFVERYWRPRMEAGSGNRSDAKTTLQEWAQGRGFPPPRYQEDARSGPDHAPTFTISVHVDAEDPATGSGGSKREAEQAAAAMLLLRLGVWSADDV
ncbi:MAG: ribonuclease III [Pseudomonadota bacterium]